MDKTGENLEIRFVNTKINSSNFVNYNKKFKRLFINFHNH